VSRHKETATMLVTSGVSAGAVVGGLIGGPLTRDYGWQAIFIVGGVLPLILLPLFARILKQNSQLLARSGVAKTNTSTVAQLFVQGLGARTGFLWLFSFLIFLLMFAMAFWVPTLLVEFGFAREQAALGAAAFGIGGLIGNIVMMSLVAIVGVKRLLAITTLLAMACVLTISKVEISGTFVLVMIAGLGAGLVTGGVGQSALAVSLYPRSLRTTGVGWALALGRTGSIVGPAIGGLLLSFGWSARDIVLTAIFPASLAILVLAVLGIMERTREAANS
jgi:AAHS family 4-hydroxybenzoate transporter-like MFS transporter